MVFFVFLIGACLGSFYYVVGTRLPKGLNAINDRSKCDNCGHTLAWWQLMPLLSYIFLRGKCYYCQKRINPLHFIIELVMGLAFAFAYRFYGVSYQMYIFMIVSSLTILIFITDFSYYIILDSPLVIASLLVIILKLYYFNLNEVGLSILSGIVLFFTMLFIKFIGDFIFKRESLGGGDIKFAFVMGLVLGFRLGLVALIVSTFLALPYSSASLMLKKNNEVPFGPFLVSSLFIVSFFINKFSNIIDLFMR